MPTVFQPDIDDFDEIYRPIARTEDYRISRSGVVISKKRKEMNPGWWVVLKTTQSRVEHPYNRVSLYRDGKVSTWQLGALILETFVGPKPSHFHVAAHKNGISDDDRLENLLWALPKDVKHGSIVRGTHVRGDRIHTSTHDIEQVQAARKIVIEFGVPVNLLATALGIAQPRVQEWIIGVTWNDQKWDGLVCPLTGNTKEASAP